jgi:formylglycine-generating enzyme required for sulfatase activity
VDDGGCSEAAITEPECNTGRPGYESHPINCVNWYQAEAYCAWAEKRLPTEAEWEKAARGTEARLYPWGSETADCTRVIRFVNDWGCGTGETWPVGSKPAGASPYGLLNVGGNVREWVSDWYQAELEVDIDDPTGPPDGEQKVLRGGALWTGNAWGVRTSNRGFTEPEKNNVGWGIRCAAG